MNVVIEALKEFDKSYAAGKPDLTDNQYEILRDAAKSLWPKNPYWKKIAAPLPKVKGRIEATLPVRMTSLEKKRPIEAMKWVASCPKDAEFLLSPKLDGFATLLHYKDGILQKAYTRGKDGITGQVIQNIRHIQGALPVISRHADFAPVKGDIYIKAECICHQSIFDKKYSKLEGMGDYKNPRGFAIGLVNRLNHTSDTLKMLQDLTVVAYGMHREIDGKKIYCEHKLSEILQLAYWGFTHVLMPTRWNDELWKKFTNNQLALLRSADYPPQVCKPLANYWHPTKQTLSVDVLNNLLKMWRNSKELDVMQDGIVIDLCQHEYRKKMGFMDARPGFSYAIKPEAIDQETKIGTIKLHDIQISPRRLFKIVVVLEKPLIFQGSEVSRVTLHNMANAVAKGCGVGAEIKIIKSGDAIPRFMSTVKRVEFKAYAKCPHCQTPTKWTRDDNNKKVDLYCPNIKCPGPHIRTLRHFFHALKIDGMSKGTIINMVKVGLDTVPKILLADAKQLSKVEGFADKKTKNILLGLKKVVQDVSLTKLAYASGLFNSQSTGLGKTILDLILNKIGRQAFLSGVVDKNYLQGALLSVHGIGEERVELFIKKQPEFVQFFKTVSNVINLAPETKGGKLTGEVFCFTGFRNQELANLIEKHGSRVSDSLTKQVTVLFAAGESPKTAKAKSYGIKIVQKEQAEAYVQNLIK